MIDSLGLALSGADTSSLAHYRAAVADLQRYRGAGCGDAGLAVFSRTQVSTAGEERGVGAGRRANLTTSPHSKDHRS